MNAASASAHTHLAKQERVFRDLITDYGPQDPFAWHDGGRSESSLFAALLIHITGQRISAASGFTLFDRVADALGSVPTPEGVIELGGERLRGFGLTRMKVDCTLDLARSITTGRLDLEGMRARDDRTVIDALRGIRGIGLWSAQAFLMRQLQRPDVMPFEDMGIREAVGSQWNMARRPTPGEIRAKATHWSPYRSYAAALLWRSLKPVGEISDPKARALARRRAPSAERAPGS
jgi:DNA-3-methyladenine glycosylase II